MKVIITPQKLTGAITPPPSKSQAHRVIIAAALAQGESTLSNLAMSQDIAATLQCMKQLGAQVVEAGDTVRVTGCRRYPCTPCCDTPILDCGESGSTLRFLIPVALAVRQGGSFHGRGRLMERPQGPYEELFREKNIYFHRASKQIDAFGKLTPGVYKLAGDVSSQFITGLLYALPLLEGDSQIVLTTPLESRGYIDMTIDALGRFGVRVEELENGWHIPGGQEYQPSEQSVESDYSQAGFFYAAKGLGNDIEIFGLNPHSRQGDRVIAEYYETLSGDGEVELDVSQCPDLVPALALQAALRAGQVTRIVNAARLRIKESDRLDTVTTELNKLGAQVEQFPDSLTIHGVENLHGGVVNSHNDHRIAMMLAMAATVADGPVTVEDAGSVKKSYPDFWEDYEALGGRIERIDQ